MLIAEGNVVWIMLADRLKEMRRRTSRSMDQSGDLNAEARISFPQEPTVSV